MTRQLSKTFVTIGLVTASALTAQVSADTYQQIDRRAVRVQRAVKLLTNEIQRYRHTAEYAHLSADVRQMRQVAFRMHESARHEGSPKHLATDLVELDSSFHHFKSVLGRVAHSAAYEHGNTSNVRRLSRSIENDIQHLREDIQLLRSPVQYYPRSQVYNQPGHEGRGTHNRYNYSYGNGYRYGQANSYRIGGISFRF